MVKNNFLKYIVIGLIVLLLGASILPSISGNILKNTAKKGNNGFSNDNCDWPMFHHDLMHIGYTDCIGTIKGPCVKWDFPTTHWAESSPAIGEFFPNGEGQLEIVTADYDGKVYALDGNTGTTLWQSYQTGDHITSSPAIDNGLIYIGSHDKYIYCLYGNNGTLKWRYETNDSILFSSPAVADGKVYIGSLDNYLYCLDADPFDDGFDEGFDDPPGVNYDLIWKFEAEGGVRPSPAIKDGMVYVGCLENYVYCVDAYSGFEIWRYKTGDEVRSSPAVVDDRVYIGSSDDNVYCFDADTSDEIDEGFDDPPEVDYDLIWVFETDGNIISSPAVVDGMVYIGSMDNNMYCIYANNGTKKWAFETDGIDVKSAPALGDVDGNDGGQLEVIFGAYNEQDTSYFYSMDSLTGDVEWKFKAENWFDSSPALGDIDNDGFIEIVVGSGEVDLTGPSGCIYAFDEDNTIPQCEIRRPIKGHIYSNDKDTGEMDPFGRTRVIGSITIWIEVIDDPCGVPQGIERVDFYCNDDFLGSVGQDHWDPEIRVYKYFWKDPPSVSEGGCTLRVVVYDKCDNTGECEIISINPRSKMLEYNKFLNFPRIFKNFPDIISIIKLLQQQLGL